MSGKVIDSHVHLSERHDDALTRFARINGLGYTMKELLSTMRKHEVGRGLLLSPPLQGTTCLPNDQVIALCRRSEGMLAPVITVDPSIEEVKTAIHLAEVNKSEVKGFKVRLGYVKASADSPVFDPLYEYAESKELPVLFHTGDTSVSNGELANSHPLTLDRLANKRPELIIILCHFGNPWFEDAAELTYKHPNVYADTSGLITGDFAYAEKYAEWLSRKISEAIYFTGNADKVIFGTDYPVTRHADALALVKRLEVDERDKEKILYHNAQRVFNL